MPKDTQRTKIFRVQDELGKNLPTLSADEAREVVDKIARSRWWGHRLPNRRTFVVQFGSGPWNPCSGMGDRLCLGMASTLKLPGVLHQMAHFLAPGTDPAHNHQFAAAYLQLVIQVMGKEVGNAMRSAYRAEHIKTSTWSPEAKAAAQARSGNKRLTETAERARRLLAALAEED